MEIVPDPVHVALLMAPFACAALALHLILWKPLLAWMDERDATSETARHEASQLDAAAAEQLARIEARWNDDLPERRAVPNLVGIDERDAVIRLVESAVVVKRHVFRPNHAVFPANPHRHLREALRRLDGRQRHKLDLVVGTRDGRGNLVSRHERRCRRKVAPPASTVAAA